MSELGRVHSESDERTINNGVRHKYRVLTDAEKASMVFLKDRGQDLIDAIVDNVPAGREASLAKTRVEEAVMWAVKGLNDIIPRKASCRAGTQLQ